MLKLPDLESTEQAETVAAPTATAAASPQLDSLLSELISEVPNAPQTKTSGEDTATSSQDATGSSPSFSPETSERQGTSSFNVLGVVSALVAVAALAPLAISFWRERQKEQAPKPQQEGGATQQSEYEAYLEELRKDGDEVII